MDLDIWLLKNRCTRTKMAQDLEVHYQSIMGIALRRRSPSLIMALKISAYTNGAVAPRDLLADSERQGYENFVKTLRQKKLENE